jgi:PAS domain S-box-containing protein
MVSNKKSHQAIKLPVRLLLLTIISIMATDIVVAAIMKVLAPLALWEELLIDSFLLALILLPILYIFEFRPLAVTIADRNRQEEKSIKSEEKFTKASMTSPDSININRLSDGMFVSINNGFTKILGYTEEEVIGKTSVELNIWDDQGKRKELVKELQQSSSIVNFEADFRKKDGTIVNGLMSASIIEIDGVPHILNETKDITQLRLINKALAFEQFLVNAIMNSLPDHVYFKDTESRFLRVSRSHALSFGFDDPVQIVGKSDFDFFTEDAARQAYEDEQNIINTGQRIIKEEKLTRKDNTMAWFSAMKLPLRDNDGKIIGTFGLSRDITDRKRTELENKINFDITQGITTTSNFDELLNLIHQSLGKVVYAENCFIALFNRKTGLFNFPYFVDKLDETPASTSMARSCSAYVFRTAKPYLFSNESFDQLQRQNEVELIGSPSPSWIGIPLQTPSDIIGVLVLQHYEKENVYSEKDVNFLVSIGSQIAIAIERKKSEEEIKLKNELLEAVNAEKDKFFSILAHDLRGPMSAFVAVTQILTEDIQNMTLDEIREITISLKTDASNIYRLLENLLEWSRLQRSVMEFKPEELNLKNTIGTGIEVVSASAQNKGISIDISVPDKLNIVADKHMFETVIRNLVSNSVKFTPIGGRVTVSASVNNDNNIEISIVDTGIGMSVELKNKLFMLNEKTSRKGTEGELSSGLGLLLCKEFVEKHNGKIWAESEEGKGSTFRFTLPEIKKVQ